MLEGGPGQPLIIKHRCNCLRCTGNTGRPCRRTRKHTVHFDTGSLSKLEGDCSAGRIWLPPSTNQPRICNCHRRIPGSTPDRCKRMHTHRRFRTRAKSTWVLRAPARRQSSHRRPFLAPAAPVTAVPRRLQLASRATTSAPQTPPTARCRHAWEEDRSGPT